MRILRKKQVWRRDGAVRKRAAPLTAEHPRDRNRRREARDIVGPDGRPWFSCAVKLKVAT